MGLFLAGIGFISIIIGFIGFVILFIMKKPKKAAVILVVVGIVLFIIGAIITPLDELGEQDQPEEAVEGQKNVIETEKQETTPVILPASIEKTVQEAKPVVEQPTAVDPPTKSSGTTNLLAVTLVQIIDGDTIKIMYNGKEQNVRYLLIDTPETNHPQLGKQPFGDEAKQRNIELIHSGKLEIEFDIGQRYDKYDRLLAYIYVDGKSVQETLLEEGLARVAYVYPPNIRYLDTYEKAQAKAKEQKLGIWSIENYATDTGFNTDKVANEKPVTPKAEKTTPERAAPVQQPVVAPVPQAIETEWFQNCTELRKKYPNGVPAGHPAYQSKMDRDGDNFACEQ
ncbi:thermonuclease family protein [Sporosarcina sp. GW1-11]|uniref:thermonuclease family protein n=1 Tax=Sporosarcina sp. GW1-11 TaxID=2899126 RepID=UPI002955799F|nr:thermonuclease family protein [Sporosarcina sp. GW1-11]